MGYELWLADFSYSFFEPFGFDGHFVIIEEGREFLVAGGGVEFEPMVDFAEADWTEMERGAVGFIEVI